MTRIFHHGYLIRAAAVGLGALSCTWAVAAIARQATPPPPPQRMILIPPPAAIRFQQSVQQQQVRSQLQQRQLESDLRRSVTEQAARPLAPDSGNRVQLEQAEQAQTARDQAAQQSLANQYWGVGAAQRPAMIQPARARSGH